MLATTKKVIKTVTGHMGPRMLKRKVHDNVDRTDTLNSSPKHAEINPLLQKHWKKVGVDNSFQHPSIGSYCKSSVKCYKRYDKVERS
jgi:hypothetical protein